MIKRYSKNKKSFRLMMCIFGILTVFTANSFAQDVPANLQSALFKKIFSFNKTLQTKGSLEVAILSSDGTADEIAGAFKGAGINTKVVKGSQVPAGSNVVYVMPGVVSPKGQTSSKGVLSISGDASYVTDGKVAIGLGLEGGKPKIIIHLAQLKAEGQELSADLLKIAKVIQ